jgi:DNA-directed RNA polymerase specialized sigma24 family protein
MASSWPGKPSRLLISRSAAEERLQGMGTKHPFEKVVEEHGGTVLRVCRVLLANHDADDAWSETFLAAITAYPGLPETANVEAWPGAKTTLLNLEAAA